ncbi:MAG: DNA-binding protein [Ruminiclostridium sp.]|nr:DNA-binding protein [Ruminiclostridium sp.]
MAKDLGYTILFDIYAPLLTDKMRDTLDLYYNEDLSLAEIAETSGISRQAVMNCVRSCEKRLNELEEQFGLYEKTKKADELIGLLEQHTDGSNEAKRLIEGLKKLINS